MKVKAPFQIPLQLCQVDQPCVGTRHGGPERPCNVHKDTLRAGLMLGWGLPGLLAPSPRAYPGFKNYHLVLIPQALVCGFPRHALWDVGPTKPRAPNGLGFLVHMERVGEGYS